MFNKFTLSLLILFSFVITIYPSQKENTKLFDYCYSLEKLLARNSLEKSKNLSKKVKSFAKDIFSFSIKNTKGALVKEIIDQYKNSNKFFIINFLPNQFYCLTGYWIEELNPGTFQSIFYEKSKERINKYIDIKEEADEFIKDINSEYESIKKEIYDFF